MTELIPFAYAPGQSVRTLLVDGNSRFVALDVCAVLDLGNPTMATRSLDEDEKGLNSVETPGGAQQMVTITESGLYSLILRSRKPEAKAFKRWVTHELIPAARRGLHAPVPRIPANYAEALRAAADAVERAEVAEVKATLLELPAKHWDALADAEGDYAIREAAQILDRDPLITTGQNRLMAYLREIKWVDWNGIPYQAQVDCGRLVRRAISYDHPHTGDAVLKSQVRITPKGLAELHKRLGGFGNVGNVVAA